MMILNPPVQRLALPELESSFPILTGKDEIAEMEIEDNPLIVGLLGHLKSLLICAPSGVVKSLLAQFMACRLGKWIQ